MIDTRYRRVGIYDICNVYRALNENYPKGTIYVRISATDGEVHITENDSVLNGDVAVFIPKQYIPPYYLWSILQREFPEFMSRYVGTNINIQMDSLKYLNVCIHESIETQSYFNSMYVILNRKQDAEQRQVDTLKDLKKAMLNKLFI